MVAQLKEGMTREQVIFVLGTPLLNDIFHADRWDYPYYNKPGYGDAQERRFTVWFENDIVVRWEGDQQPDYQPFQTPDADEPARQPVDNESLNSTNESADEPQEQETTTAPVGLDTPSIMQGSAPNQPDSQPLR